MNQKQMGSIARRIGDALSAYSAGKYDVACIHLFPALDKTAKKRRPKSGVGERIRSFIEDKEGVISFLGIGSFIRDLDINGTKFPDALYKFGRTSIVHEGELDPRLCFNDGRLLAIGEVWNLPSDYILALCIAVMSARENFDQIGSIDGGVKIRGRDWNFDEIWGAEQKLSELIKSQFPGVGDKGLY